MLIWFARKDFTADIGGLRFDFPKPPQENSDTVPASHLFLSSTYEAYAIDAQFSAQNQSSPFHLVLPDDAVRASPHFPLELGLPNRESARILENSSPNFAEIGPGPLSQGCHLEAQLRTLKSKTAPVKFAVIGMGGALGDALISLAVLRIAKEHVTSILKQPVELNVFLPARYYTLTKPLYVADPLIKETSVLPMTAENLIQHAAFWDTTEMIRREGFASMPLADSMLYQLGIEPDSVPGTQKIPQLQLQPETVHPPLRALLARLKQENRPLILIHPLASAHVRCMPESVFVALVKSVLSHTDAIVLSFQKVQSDSARLVDISALTPTFHDLAYLVSELNGFISVDTVIYHLAAAFKIPGVVLFSTIAPHLRIRDYPSIRGMVLPGAEKSAFWGQHKDVDGQDSAALQALWERLNPRDVLQQLQQQIQARAQPAGTDWQRWQDSAALLSDWHERSRVIAKWIPTSSRVLDLGCGAMTLEKHLPKDCQYIPCDLVQRDARTLVADFNQGEMPAVDKVDVVTLLGVLEYIEKVPDFLQRLRDLQAPLIVSYNPTDATQSLDRKALGWLNHYSVSALKALFAEAGFLVQEETLLPPHQVLLRLTPIAHQKITVKPLNILVLSYHTVGNFGDRLGFHLLNQCLPPHATVTYAPIVPLKVQPKNYDLLILGIGNSLFQPLLTDELLALMDNIPRAIGIFGTQYRETIDTKKIAAVLGKLDTWFARYQDDIEHYGRHAKSVVHLGDWLIDACPMAQPTSAEILTIGKEIWQDLPLDRTIQRIQRYERVFSTRLHPLLCALTSAASVAYSEQREHQGAGVSGKFRSMFLDIFGKDYPENQFFTVDRDAVMAYKQFVRGQCEKLAKFAF